MTELVEHGVHLVEGEQGRSSRGGLHDVQMVRHHGLGLEQPALGHIGVHPGAPTLAGPGIGIEEEEPQGRLIQKDFKDLHIRVVSGQGRARFEAQPIELPGEVEDPLPQHAIHLKVGLQGLRIDGVALGPKLLRVEAPIPGFQCVPAPLAVDQGLQRGAFAPGVGHGPGGQPAQHRFHGFRRLRRLIGHGVSRVVFKAQEGRFLCPELQDRQDPSPVIKFATAMAPGLGGLLQPLSKGAMGEVSHDGLPRGVAKGDEPAVRTQPRVLRGLGKGRSPIVA